MNEILYPETVDQLKQAVESAESVLPVGQRTKPALSARSQATLVSLAKMRGIIEYEPSEFTFTAWAGTPIAEVSAVLAEQNQYLPFDPLLVDAGATLGGTVAAGISGPGRVRYGGLRDFLLGVRLLCGDGNLVNVGGKVVKNAAGFDIPKLLVGALGRLGVMMELTFKVFPKAPLLRTYQFPCQSDGEAIERIAAAATARWELDAIDYRPDNRTVYLRIGGPESAIEAIAKEIGQQWKCDLQPLDPASDAEFWGSVRELNWPAAATSEAIVKVPITPASFVSLGELVRGESGLSSHLSGAGAVLWVAAESADRVDELAMKLKELSLSGLVIRGTGTTIWLGRRADSQMAASIKLAMDPTGKFPNFE